MIAERSGANRARRGVQHAGAAAQPGRRSLVVSLAAVAIAALASAAWLQRAEVPLALGSFALTGFEPCGEGCFRGTPTANGFHLIESEIAPIAGADYTGSVAVRRLPGVAVRLGADFFAPGGYDDAEQEALVRLGMESLERGVRFHWNAGEAPARARFRVFYDGPPGVELGAPTLSHAPRWTGSAQHALVALGSASLLVLAGIAAARVGQRAATSPRRAEIAVVAIVYLALVPLRALQFAATPLWAGDEYAYKSMAAGFYWRGGVGAGGLGADRIGHTVAFPNLLYPALIAPTLAFGEQFHFVLRAVNAALLTAALFPAYALARRFLGPGWSLGFAVFAATLPFTSLGAYALTEVAFYPLFLCWAWAALRALEPGASPIRAAAAGALVGVLGNVRPNAPVLLGVLAFAFPLVAWAERRSRAEAIQNGWLVAPAACVAVGALLYAATHGLSPVGLGLYDVVLRSGQPRPSFPPSAHVDLALGHLAGVAVPYAVPIALASLGLVAAARGRWQGDGVRFALLALGSLAALVAVALAFTERVAPFDLGGLGRWHARYYFHATPLVLLAGVAAARRPGLGAVRERAALLALTALGLSAGAAFLFGRSAARSPWFGSIVDGMDAQWLRHHEALYLVFALASLGVAALVSARSRRAPAAAAIVLVAWLAVANQAVLGTTRIGDADPAGDCGRMAGMLLAGAPGRFVVGADERGAAVRVAFTIPYLPQRVVWAEDLARERDTAAWHEVEYAVLYGDVAPGTGWRPAIDAGACRVYRLR